jgi:hypothetical protein
MNDIQTEIDYLYAQFNAIQAEVMPTLRRYKPYAAYLPAAPTPQQRINQIRDRINALLLSGLD